MDGNVTNSTNLSVDQPTATQSRTGEVTATHMDLEDFELVDKEREDMAHDIKMLKEQVLHLNTELGRMRDLQQQNSGQATGAVPLPHTDRDLGEIVKPPLPNRIGGQCQVFNGQYRMSLQPFLAQLQAYFMFFPSHFRSDTYKVLFAVQLMEGCILSGYASWVRQVINDPEGASPDVKDVMTNYRRFELDLLQGFGTPKEKQYAEDELKKL